MAEPQRSRNGAASRGWACLLVIALGALFAGTTEAGLEREGGLRGDGGVSAPPVLERNAEFLHPFGERFSFLLRVPGQRAELSVDLVPGTRVLFRFVGNTIATGCARPVVASLVGPHGRLWSKTRLCTGRETITFRATKDGLHYLRVDPPAGRTGGIVVVLYLDQPEVEAGGPFEDLTFINGSRSYRLSAAAAYRKGIARVWVREAGAATLLSSSRCRSRCPVRRTLRAMIDTRRLGEGEHEFHAEAMGSDGRSSGVEAWRVVVDRTPPRPPKNFRLESYDAVQRTAVVVWDEGSDPELRDGTPGAGSYGHDYRLRAEDGSWSRWRQADAGTLAIGGILPGRLIELRVREYDGARNVSRIAEAGLRVTGSEPRPEDPDA